MHYLVLLVIAGAILYGYFLLVRFLFADVGPEVFYVTALLCSVGVQIGYARVLFRTFATSRVWYRRLAFGLACGLLGLTTIDLLYIGAGVGVARLDAHTLWWILDVIGPVVRAQGDSPWLSFTVKSAFIAPLVLLARGFASTAIEDGEQPAFRSYFYGPAWLDVATTVREVGGTLKQAFPWMRTVLEVSVVGWHGLLTWPLAIVVGLATLPALAVAGVQLLLTVAMHSVFLVVFWLVARMCAIVILLVEKAVIRVRSRHAKCPHAACHAPVPLPVFRCPECNEKHDRLIPGRCGVLVRTCKCGKGRLPTLFWLGKGRLASECPGCHKPLREELFGADVHIPIYGGPSAGKTMYMMAVTWEAVSNRRSAPDVKARLIDKPTQYDRYWKPDFERGAVREKTAAPFPDAFLLSMRRGQGAPAALYVYDPAGEAFRDTETIAGHNFLEYSDGVAILIDPLSLSSFAGRYTEELGKDVPSTTSGDPTSTVNRIVNQLQRLGWGKKPVALVLTKADVEGFENEFGVDIGASRVGADWKGVGADRSATLAKWFRDNEPHLLNLLETHFSEVRFFAVSSLGRDPEASGAGRAFSPQRVMEPIAWLLSRRAKFANPLRERFTGPLKELGAAAAVIGLLVLLPGFAFLKWGVPYVAGAWTGATAHEEPVRAGALPDAFQRLLAEEPEATTYAEAVRAGAPQLTADRVSFIRLSVDESGILESLGDEDVKGYLHVIPCGPPLRVSLGDREALSDDLTVLGLEHLRDSGSSHVEYSDDDGRNLNFRFEVTGGECYVLSAEGYNEVATGPYTLRAEPGGVRYRFVTYSPTSGWSGWTPWASLPRVGAAAQAAALEDTPAAQPEEEDAPAAEVARARIVQAVPAAREDSAARAREAARAAEARARAREDSVARARQAARATAAQAREDSAARAREAARVAAARARAREDSVARARQAARATAARAREDSAARAREAARVAAARAREDAAIGVDERRISSDFRELEQQLVFLYSQLTWSYLRLWRAVDWDDERPRVVFRGNSSTDYQASQENQSFRDGRRQAGNRLRSDLLNAVSASQAVQRRMTPSIEAAHQEYQQKVDQHYDRLAALIGNVAGRVSALLIDVNPSDTRVFINDVLYGTAREFANEPGRLIPSGTFRVRLEREGYRTHEETVRTRPYERHFIRGDMPRSQ